jgi:hypothetical protein
MFNRNEPEQPRQPEQPPTPTLRTFAVRRYNEETDQYESLTVRAHAVAIADGDRTVFQTWRIDPALGPQLQVSMLLKGIMDLDEVAVTEPSRLVQ